MLGTSERFWVRRSESLSVSLRAFEFDRGCFQRCGSGISVVASFNSFRLLIKSIHSTVASGE